MGLIPSGRRSLNIEVSFFTEYEKVTHNITFVTRDLGATAMFWNNPKPVKHKENAPFRKYEAWVGSGFVRAMSVGEGRGGGSY